MHLNVKDKKKLNKKLYDFNNYFSTIPLREINDTLKENGFILIQEDNTEWSGFLCGESSSTIIQIGKFENGLDVFETVENSALSISWHKMESGRYEIVIYLN